MDYDGTPIIFVFNPRGELEVDTDQRRQQELIAGAGEVLSMFLGGRRRTRSLSGIASRRSQTRRTKERLRSAAEKLLEYEEAIEELEEEAKAGKNVYRVAMRCERVLQRYERQKECPFVPMDLHVVRVGDVAFAKNRFELFLDYGIRIKARSPAVQTFLVQLAANDGWYGTYVPTARAVANSGYGGSVYDYEVGPEGGEVIVEETVDALNELWGE